MDEKDELIKLYGRDLDVCMDRLRLLEIMLDQFYMKDMVRQWNIKSVYIYGGGLLGVQFYHAAKDLVNICGIIDKKKKTIVELKDVDVLGLEDLQIKYRNEPIIVTPITFYYEIKDDIKKIAEEKNIIYLGELLGGRGNAVHHI